MDEITYDYEENGVLVRKEIAKEFLSKGAWSTVMFKYQEFDAKTSTYRAPKVALVRFKKSGGKFIKQSGFNITNKKQALQISDILQKWFLEEENDEEESV
ncbi:hypothetical protein KKF34_13090 [Myxococcota bacterium]|nr:hypothetical protein [Myxococcota bacterium]MBU1381902.1 hypothetical protein [Myxococcota bacterium]MBU1497803.1 hypothetical protein [Myxococcota bacterium]